MAKCLELIQISKNHQEFDQHGSFAFPCELYYTVIDGKKRDRIPGHWHDELEIGYVDSGRVLLETASENLEIREGQCYFINSHIVHGMRFLKERGSFYSFVFHENMIKGPEAINQNAVYPILESSRRVFTSDDDRLNVTFKKLINVFEGNQSGYELSVRHELEAFWLRLLELFPVEASSERVIGERIGRMLGFIEKHFADNIGIIDIAKSADISKRECYRCFKERLGETPGNYLMRYRVTQAAKRIVLTSDHFEVIAKECGFASASYFSTRFKKVYGLSPGEYRKQERQKEESSCLIDTASA